MTLIYIRRIHLASNTHFFLLLAPLHWERAPYTTMNTILPSLQSSHQLLHPTSMSKAAQGRKGNLNHNCRVSCSHLVSLEARIHFSPLRMGLDDNMGDNNLAMHCSLSLRLGTTTNAEECRVLIIQSHRRAPSFSLWNPFSMCDKIICYLNHSGGRRHY